ncbi:MAG: DNA/RNA non-specific endonuclease, partial [Alphaproteobacteria bacterium]|nr:DNA/RNA non-specific endonuclease [Alphaproteobacteria bacterium]
MSLSRLHPVWLAVALAASGAATADDGFSACLTMFPGEEAPSGRDPYDADLCKMLHGEPVFAVRYDTRRKWPDWTAHRLTRDHAGRLQSRARPRFYPDAALPNVAQTRDATFTRSGFSRGHLVPAHDLSWDGDAYRMSFALTNVAAQIQAFNAGAWLDMENAYRDAVKRLDVPVWSISGVYGDGGRLVGEPPYETVPPRCFYKILATRHGDGTWDVLAAVFPFDDTASTADWRNRVTSVSRIAERSGVRFPEILAAARLNAEPIWGRTG